MLTLFIWEKSDASEGIEYNLGMIQNWALTVCFAYSPLSNMTGEADLGPHP
ncbi:hypothetical protein Oscil6304_0090 [Oscillatoria acuminata PCC 6304]|uniref:Uncharacterized protein n=1 Tax=Oscillatoria acuminata PCC 6304 TaxID=56110 RepID=K9TBR6_9CYAN|nr:hypothetical protein Oscil6304_0090 [Oscillatoria acuminata PCC 6304]